MGKTRRWTGYIPPIVLTCAAAHFAFAAVQGNYGLFQHIQIEAERDQLAAELAVLQAEVTRMDILTTRLSDGYLDMDLLDEMARQVLGQLRPDEIVLP